MFLFTYIRLCMFIFLPDLTDTSFTVIFECNPNIGCFYGDNCYGMLEVSLSTELLEIQEQILLKRELPDVTLT